MTATTEQLLAMLQGAVPYLEHYEYCEHRINWHEGVVCDCGMRELMVRVEDALANQRPESSTCLPRRAIKVVNTGKDDGDDDGN